MYACRGRQRRFASLPHGVVLPLALLVATSGLCTCGGAAVDPNTSPIVTFQAPAEDVRVPAGSDEVVWISFSVRDPGGGAVLDVIADGDGDERTTGDQVHLACVHAGSASRIHEFAWNPEAARAGTYVILAQTSDEHATVTARATGRVFVNGAPVLELIEPADDLVLSRGGLFSIRYVDDDPDDTAMTVFWADLDGDPDTAFDSCTLTGLLPERGGTAQSVLCNCTRLQSGPHHIVGTTWDGTNPPVTAEAPGTATVLNVAEAHGTQSEGSSNALAVRAVGRNRGWVVAGEFDGSTSFGVGTPGESSVHSSGINAFFARYGPGGEVWWARSAGGSDETRCTGLDLGPGETVVATGTFQGSAYFLDGTWTEEELHSAGATDVFVAWIGSGGDLGWVRQAGGPEYDAALDIATVDDQGGCVVVGFFAGAAKFGAGSNEQTLISSGGYDAFVARYSGGGSLSWVRRDGGAETDAAVAVAPAPGNGMVVAGQFRGRAVFGAEGSSVRELDSAGLADVYVARYDGTGEMTWATRAGGDEQDEAVDVATFGDGSFVVAGIFRGTATFGDGARAVSLASSGATDVFVARYEADGQLAWARRLGGPSPDSVEGVAALADGSCVATGSFEGAVKFGEADLAGRTLTTQGLGTDVWVARLSRTGALMYVRRDGGPGADYAHGLSAYPDGSFVVCGQNLGYTATFGEGEDHETTLWGWPEMFVARYNADGGF